jgi:hypothetical protein
MPRRFSESLFTLYCLANLVKETYYPLPVMMTREDFRREATEDKNISIFGEEGKGLENQSYFVRETNPHSEAFLNKEGILAVQD